MAKIGRTRRAVLTWWAFIGSIAYLFGAQFVGSTLIERAGTPARAMGALIGMSALAPLILSFWWIIRTEDEFSRRTHVLAMSLAFVGSLLLAVVFDWLARLGLYFPRPFAAMEAGMMVLWVAGVLIARRYYGRER